MTHVLTLIANRAAGPLSLGLVAAMRDAVGGTLDVLSPNEAVDIACAAAPDPADVAAIIGTAAVDAIVTAAEGRRKRLLVSDMDSTIVTSETLDELAAHAGLQERVAAITARSMNGEIDFATALRERVGMLRGLGVPALAATWQRTRIMPGAGELVATMRAHGAVTALVSGGFSYFTGRVAVQLGFHIHRANTLLDDGDTLLGTVGEPILDGDAKLATLRELAGLHGLGLSETLAVGDGANDLAMIEAAGLGVAYHAKPVVAARARAQVRHADLRALLFAQGYPATAFVTG